MSVSIFQQFTQLTPVEQRYLSTHAHHIPAIRGTRQKAYDETRKRFGFNGKNDKSDAFRHCYWAALLVRAIGYDNALYFTSAHESSPANPAREKEMDLHNNAVGLGIGLAGGSEQSVAVRCMNALLTGQLKTLK